MNVPLAQAVTFGTITVPVKNGPANLPGAGYTCANPVADSRSRVTIADVPVSELSSEPSWSFPAPGDTTMPDRAVRHQRPVSRH